MKIEDVEITQRWKGRKCVDTAIILSSYTQMGNLKLLRGNMRAKIVSNEVIGYFAILDGTKFRCGLVVDVFL